MFSYFVSGFHHSGTTALQHLLIQQKGFKSGSKLISGRYDECLPKNVVGHVFKSPCCSSTSYIDAIFDALYACNVDMRVIIMKRPLHQSLFSLYKRQPGTDFDHECKMYKYAMNNWNEYSKTHSGRVSYITLNALVETPHKILREIGIKEPIVANKSINVKERPPDRKHAELREWQCQQPVNKAMVSNDFEKAPEKVKEAIWKAIVTHKLMDETN